MAFVSSVVSSFERPRWPPTWANAGTLKFCWDPISVTEEELEEDAEVAEFEADAPLGDFDRAVVSWDKKETSLSDGDSAVLATPLVAVRM